MNSRILVAGGYGVFGALLTREILRASPDVDVIVAGRDERKAAASIEHLGPRASALPLDLNDLEAVEAAASSVAVAVCAAGPFHELPAGLVRAVVEAGASWIDIADEKAWVARILGDPQLDDYARGKAVTVATGLSSVPAVSGFLARLCRERLPDASRARVTLFVGNKNPKGPGAVASAIAGGFRDPVPADTPLGRFRAYAFPSPDEALFRDDLGLDAHFRVALELGVAGAAAAALGRVAAPGVTLARIAARIAGPLRVLGSDRGLVQVEVWGASGARVSACAVGSGQRIAIVPAAVAAIAAASGSLDPGVVHPVTWLGRDAWLAALRRAGVTVLRSG